MSAVISPCGVYRYRLGRYWSDRPALPFIMLNPSTADASLDDPTIRRCIGFAKREDADGIIVVNLYALRATDPKQLKIVANPIGPDADVHIEAVGSGARLNGMPIVCAWGAGASRGRADRALRLLERSGAVLACLGKTAAGHPRHPLYVRGDQALVDFP